MNGDTVTPQPPAAEAIRIEDLEARLLLEGVFQKYGYDLRGYAPAAIKRWIHRRLVEERMSSVAGLQEKILRHPAWMDRFLMTVSDCGPSFFRDPGFYLAFRSRIVPLLRTYPSVRIWIAGCSIGEEAYSLAILLEEEKLYEKTRIYATDQSEVVIKAAKEGVFPADRKDRYLTNYREAGGNGTFADFSSRVGEQLRFRPALRKNIVFGTHCLATDSVFNEFHVVLCRNVLGSCAPPLQERIAQLLHRSLIMFGTLCLGAGETLGFSPLQWAYQDLDARHGVYRKVKET